MSCNGQFCSRHKCTLLSVSRLQRIGLARVYHTGKGTQFVEALKQVVGGEGHAESISVMELLIFVVMAAARRQQWEGQTILYVTDNANVQAWLRNRRSKNRYVRALLLLVQRLEAESNFTVDGVYVRTYHNCLSDWLTREEEPTIHKDMQRRGWTKLDLQDDFEKLLQGALTPTLCLPREEGASAQLARQLARGRETCPRKRLLPTTPFRGVTHQVTLNPYLWHQPAPCCSPA